MDEKKKIFYSRTYRRLKINKFKKILYIGMLIGPALYLLRMNMVRLTGLMSNLGVKVLGEYFPDIPLEIAASEISIFGWIEYVNMPTVYPERNFIIINLILVLALLLLIFKRRKKGELNSVFVTMVLMIHVISCIYFLFLGESFPYSALEYSDLYMKQQIGVWVIFIILTSLATSVFGKKGLVYKLLTFTGIMLYSIVFGIIRYVVFLYVLQRFSILYMTLMFFIFGPLFDFLYLVGIYGMFVNKMISLYSTKKARSDWVWP